MIVNKNKTIQENGGPLINQNGTSKESNSDRCSQYACQDYQGLLAEHETTPSMSRQGNCWDNAVIERFFRSLKCERTNDLRYGTREEAKMDVIDYIEMFYNSHRYHSYLGYRSPANYEKLAEVA